MPNWCENDLTVKGNKKELNKFYSWCKEGFFEKEEDGDGLDFNVVIPYPFKYMIADITHKAGESDGYNQGGYGWCTENWGTKWGGARASHERTKTSIKITFDTAWSPPIPIIIKLSEGFPKLTFNMRFYEQGVGYKGLIKARGGETLEAKEEEYHGHRGG